MGEPCLLTGRLGLVLNLAYLSREGAESLTLLRNHTWLQANQMRVIPS